MKKLISKLKKFWDEFNMCSFVEISWQYKRGWGKGNIYVQEKFRCVKCGRIITVNS